LFGETKPPKASRGDGTAAPKNSVLSSPKSPPTLLKWPCQGRHGPGLAPPPCPTFPLVLTQRGMAPCAACECGAEERTVDHLVLHYPIHLPPYGMHGPTVLDDETIEWLLNTCPEIYCGLAVDCKNWLKR